MRRKLILLLALTALALAICCAAALADDSGSCGENVTYFFDSRTGTLIISGTGEMRNYEESDMPWYDYSGDIFNVVIDDGVTSIGIWAFYDCSSLTSVTIPESVTSIGDCAFYGCTSLTSVTIPDSVTIISEGTFHSCSSLTSVTIPDSVTGIDGNAFNECTSLTSITIPDSVSYILNDAFAYCTSLSSVTIPYSVTWIDSEAFFYCTSLTEATILNPDCDMFNFWLDVFEGCPSDLVLHGWEGSTAQDYAHKVGIAFESLGGLPDSYGEIVTYSFDPDTGTLTFSGTRAMRDYDYGPPPWYDYRSDILSVVIEDGVTGIGDYAFEDCDNLTNIMIPDSVTSIGIWAFYNCSSLTSVTIPESVISIGSYTFFDCKSLSSITIPNSVTSIGSYTFFDCNSLNSITIPNSVTYIDYCAFRDCPSLTDVTILNPDCVIGDEDYDVFKGCPSDLVLHGWEGSTTQAYAEVAGITFEALAEPAPDPTFFLPAAMTAIEEEAFAGISTKAVFIPSTVTAISGNPFAGSGVKYIYGFPGTAAEALANSEDNLTFVPVDDAWLASH